MSQRPYASDWKEIEPGLEYSAEIDRYWHNGRVYDERSARHNGLVGMGAQLKRLLKEG